MKRKHLTNVPLTLCYPKWCNAHPMQMEACTMSNEQRLALRTLSVSMNKNISQINRKLQKAGVSSDDPLVFSIAKYFAALNKLAEEK